MFLPRVQYFFAFRFEAVLPFSQTDIPGYVGDERGNMVSKVLEVFLVVDQGLDVACLQQGIVKLSREDR